MILTQYKTVLKGVFYSVFTFCLSFSSIASEDNIPDVFRGDTYNSKYKISYIDLDAILTTSVLIIGKSSRAKAKQSRANIGTRMRTNINRLTALEGNRFYYESYKKEEYRQLISKIRLNLAELPSKIPLNKFTKKEQLAYWLNLYNVTLLDEVIKIYPQKKLEDFFEDEDDALLNQKLLTVSGIKLSLNDIHNILFEKYNADPLIIYGLYQGIIGGPNIRKKAFSGDNVWEDLEINADNFINSNRGTYGDKKNVFRVSSLYKRNKDYFPNFDEDLTKHLQAYLIGHTRYKLEDAKKIKANINNWNITDVYGTDRTYGASAATNSAGLLDPMGNPDITGTVTHFDGTTLTFRPTGNLPGGDAGNAGFRNTNSVSMASLVGSHGVFSADQIERLKKLNELRIENTGVVTIIDLPNENEGQVESNDQ